MRSSPIGTARCSTCSCSSVTTALTGRASQAIRSDYGRTWSKPITLGGASATPVNDRVSEDTLNTFRTFPAQTVAPNGDVYVAWAKPEATNKSSRRRGRQVYEWRPPLARLGVPVRGQAAFPAIAVAGDGTVGLLYYSFAPSSHAGFWPGRVAIATSRDHGHHWSRTPVAGPFNLLGLNSGGMLRAQRVRRHGRPASRIRGGFPMAKPIAKHVIDVFFSRVTTSRGRG